MSANKHSMNRIILAGLSMIKTGQCVCGMGLGDRSECHGIASHYVLRLVALKEGGVVLRNQVLMDLPAV